MRKLLLGILLALLAPQGAFAQSVVQSGAITVGQAARWVSNGVVGTGGTAADGLLTGIGITKDGLSSFCISSARQTAAGRQQMCFGVQASGASTISVQNYGTATAQNLEFNINGTTIVLPTGGTGFVQYTGTLVSGNLPCWSGTGGLLADCGYAITAGAANKIPYWTSATTVSSMAAAASSVLVTSSGNVPSLSQTLPSAVQTNITSLGTIGTGVWNGTAITVPFGGTGATSFTAYGVMLSGATTTAALSSLATAQIGYCLLSQGASSLPVWASCASGTGTAGGSDTQVQFNNSTNLAGSANLTWVTPALTIGQNATTTGQLKLANGGALGVSVTLQNPSATSAYNFNLPTTAGTSGQPLISGGGGSTAQSYGTLQVGGGGTACSAAAGTCLDNITNFSSTGYINRTGSGTYAFSTLIPLSAGGTNANLTASNGGIFYSTATAGAILSGTATANQHLASGASGAPAWTTATYPATTTINQILYSSSANTIAGLATGNSSALVTDSGGIPSLSQTLPSAVQGNITSTGTISSGTWQGTNIALNKGGTNAALTASNGGVFYSTATAGAILSGTATASLPLLSGSTAAPTWSTISYPTSASSGGIPYFSSSTAMASSSALTANQIMIGGGAGASPSTFACATTTTVVHGGTPPTCSAIVAGDITNNTITLGKLAQIATVTLLGNATSGTTDVTAFTLAGLTSRGAPDATNDLLLLWDSAAGTLKKVTPAAVASSATAGVSSIAGNTGAFTLTSGVTNATNAIILQQIINAQTGTSYAILDGDRAKLITTANAAAQAYTIAQAGAAGNFLTGYWVDVSNNSTNPLGVVTITATTSTFTGNGLAASATLKVLQGQTVRIVSDGTNYQVALLTGVRVVKVQKFDATGTYTPSTGLLYAVIECLGAGGGSGGNNGSATGVFSSGGGGAGSRSLAYVAAATIGASKTVTIGAGGTGGAAPNAGGNGGDTCVTSTNCGSGQICTGKGGAGGSGTGVGGLGGAGGVAGTGDVTGTGEPGQGGVNASVTTTNFLGPNGGSSPWGGGGLGVPSSSNVVGAAGTGYGAGAAGTASNSTVSTFAGGAGSGGLVIVTEYTTQ